MGWIKRLDRYTEQVNRGLDRTQRQLENEPGNRVKAPISGVGDRSTGALACPKCGGTQFKAKRGKIGKTVGVVTLGVGAVAVPKRWVKCETCGTEYQRG